MKKLDLLGVFFRSFLLQTVWNFERMQNVGFAYCILPALKKLYPDKEKRLEIIKEHLVFFNTHPYLANILIGLVIGLEESLVRGNRIITRDEIHTLKANMAGPIAAIGDAFFWATLRPFLAFVVISITLVFCHCLTVTTIWFILVGFLLLYNSIHLTVRYFGLVLSYELKTKIVKIMSDLKTQNIVDIMRLVGFLIISVVTIIYFLGNPCGIELHTIKEKVVFLILFVSSIYLIRREVSSTKLFYGIIFILVTCNMLQF